MQPNMEHLCVREQRCGSSRKGNSHNHLPLTMSGQNKMEGRPVHQTSEEWIVRGVD